MASIYSQQETINLEGLDIGSKITISGSVKGFSATEQGIGSIELDEIIVEGVEEPKNDLRKSYDKAVADRTHIEQPIPAP
jgi:hypothetical protein